MLRLFGKTCPTAAIDPSNQAIDGCDAVWVDLLEPTPEEEKWAEQLLKINVPTREEMLEIEPSSRFYTKGAATYMTMSVLYGVTEGRPDSDPITFILTDDHLVTIRYTDPKPFIAFAENCYADPDEVGDPVNVAVRLLDAIVDRLADELEASARELELISNRIFDRGDRAKRRNPERRYEALMLRIGTAQRLLTRLRETSVSASRLLGFLAASDRLQQSPTSLRHLQSLIADARALDDHSDFQADNLTFLLDASLGMISLEQNFVMKIFSVVAVVLMPPTLIAGIYGMNFKHMPELEWMLGYPMALAVILASAVLPYWWARRRGWL